MIECLLASTVEVAVLHDVVIAMLFAFFVALVATRVKLPTIIGFLIAGVLIGPHGLGFIREASSVDLMAEIGVALLLFTIGIKFPLRQLAAIKKAVFGVGFLQVAISFGLTALFFAITDFGDVNPLFMGMLVALSSTAIVLKLLEERGEAQSSYGNLAIGVLLFQDLIAIVFIVLIPAISGSKDQSFAEVAMIIGRTILVIIGLLIVARMLLPWLLTKAVHTRNREVFSLATVSLILGTAYLAASVNISLAFGAFLAGMVISESDYARQLLSEVGPLREVLTSLFFISIGMLIEPETWFEYWYLIAIAGLGIMVIKAAIVSFIGSVLGYGASTSLRSGLWISQIGEFSLILALIGHQNGLLQGPSYELLIAVAVVTMGLTPVFIYFAPHILRYLERFKWFSQRSNPLEKNEDMEKTKVLEKLSNHVIIVGFGIIGQSVAKSLREAQVPFVILELNPYTVSEKALDGWPIIYGDSTRPDILKHAGIANAKALIITVPHAVTSEAIVHMAHQLNPRTSIIVRTRFLQEIDQLKKLGAQAVFAEEYETAINLAEHAMELINANKGRADTRVVEVHDDAYALFRGEMPTDQK